MEHKSRRGQAYGAPGSHRILGEIADLSAQLASTTEAMEGSLAAANIRAHLGNVGPGAQVAIGSRIIQVQAAAGAVVTVAPEPVPPPVRRPAPTREVPRAFTGLVDRMAEIQAARTAVASGSPMEFHGGLGVGKSTLLRTLAYEPNALPDGIVFGSTRGQATSDILQMLFDAFYEFPENVKLTDTQLAGHLQAVRALVLLDDVNLGREDLDLLLDAAPASVFVTASTSRQLWGQGASCEVGGLDDQDALVLFGRGLGRELTSGELESVRRFCRTVEGNPLRILQAAAEGHYERRPLEALLEAGGRAQPAEPETKLLAAIAALGGAPVSAEHLEAITGVRGVEDVLRSLGSRGLVQASGSGFVVAGLSPAVDDATKESVIRHFADWAAQMQNAPERLMRDAGAVRGAVQLAVDSQRWGYAQKLASCLQAQLALFGLWAAWAEILKLGLKAAQALGDRAGQAFYLHQLGSRAVVLDDVAAAKALLSQAESLRRSVGDTPGAGLSRSNLSRVRPRRLPGAGLASRLLVGSAGVVAGASVVTVLAATGVIFGPTAQLTLTPGQVSFGDVTVGARSIHDLALRNDNGSSVPIADISAAGDFAVASQCPTGAALMAAHSSCTVTVTFLPSAAGTRTGSVTITQRGAGQVTALLSGTGKAVPPPGAIAFEPLTINFGAATIGLVSDPHSLVVSNSGGMPLTIGGIALAGDFSEDGTCPRILNPKDTCKLFVRFAPVNAGNRTGAVLLSYGNGTVAVASLSGQGQAAFVEVARKLDFGNVDEFTVTQSAVRLVNKGPGQLLVSSANLQAGTAFAVTSNGCSGRPIAVGGTCTISLSFGPHCDPAAPQPRYYDDVLLIAANTLGIPPTILLKGTCTYTYVIQ